MQTARGVMRCLMWVCILSCFFMVQGAEASGPGNVEERIAQLEKVVQSARQGDAWHDRIQLSGLVEVEAGYCGIDYGDPTLDRAKTCDVDLATAELALDAKIASCVEGHVLYLYEDGDLFVDEGFITLTGPETFPAYLIAGRQYLPFGNFDSHFVTDPNTLVLGETGAGSAVVGYTVGEDLIDLSIGAFNGKIDKAGDDDVISSFVAGIAAQPIEALRVGVSYISNIASSDALSEMMTDRDGDGEIDALDDLVGGWSAFAILEIARFKLIGEYLAALDNFNAGEIYNAADVAERKPSAWNAELGAGIIENLEMALRCGGSDDGGADFLPELQYGAVLNWGCFENTILALEYMHGEFEDNAQETDSFIAQLAVEF